MRKVVALNRSSCWIYYPKPTNAHVRSSITFSATGPRGRLFVRLRPAQQAASMRAKKKMPRARRYPLRRWSATPNRLRNCEVSPPLVSHPLNTLVEERGMHCFGRPRSTCMLRDVHCRRLEARPVVLLLLVVDSHETEAAASASVPAAAVDGHAVSSRDSRCG